MTLRRSLSTTIASRIGLFVLIAATIGCDRVTKHIATSALAGEPARSFLADSIRLEYAENTGGFLSLGANLPAPLRTGLFTVATGLSLLALLVMAVRRRRVRGWPLIGLCLFLAGGTSNWLDRLAAGYVVDFLNVGIGPLRTGIFNVADVALMAGCALFLISDNWRGRDARTIPTAPADGA